MPEVKLQGRLPKHLQQQLEEWADELFTAQSGSWVAVVELGHAGRAEVKKTSDGFDFLERSVTLRVEQLEIARGSDATQARALLVALASKRAEAEQRAQQDAARLNQVLAVEGTLLEGEFG